MIGLPLNKRYWLKSHDRTLSDKANAGVSPFMNHHHPRQLLSGIHQEKTSGVRDKHGEMESGGIPD